MSNTNTQTNVHNAYLHVFTNNLALGHDNEGFSWGFLVVKGDQESYVYVGFPEWRGRIAAVQTLPTEKLALFEDQPCVTLSNSDVKNSRFGEDNPWRSLVKLSDSDYALLTNTTEQYKPRARKIIGYLRRTVSGFDNDDTVYEVPEDTFTENELRV